MKYCHNCGQSIDDKAVICIHCGVQQPRVSGSSASLEGRNRIVAAAIAILFGGIGGHKFYLGETNVGCMYLLFCWTFIPFIIGIIEGITYLSMTDEEFALKYG